MMKRWSCLGLFLFFCGISGDGFSQDFMGSWKADWSQIQDKNALNNPYVEISLEQMDLGDKNDLIWIFSLNTLEVFLNGEGISKYEIRWLSDSSFEIIVKNEI